MLRRGAYAWLPLLLVLGAGPGCTGDGGRTTRVTVERAAAVAQLDPRFLSVAVDSGHVAGGELWCPDAEADTPCPGYDFGRARLRALAGELTPGLLRIGGTPADMAYVDLSAAPVETPPEGYRWVLTAERWEAIHAFARDSGLELMFTLNAGPGPRDEEGSWRADQARLLMEHAAERDQPVAAWELGNEPEGYIGNFGLEFARKVTAERHAEAFRALRGLRDEVDPDARVVGPAGAWWPVAGEFGSALYADFMAEGGGEALDAVTWHYYPQQSERCPIDTRRAESGLLLEPAHLAEFDIWAEEVEAEAAEHASGRPVWLGETGNAQCGGQPGISDRFESTLWWVDQLGRSARRGQRVVVRQTLSGLSYGLLDDETLEPRPDYWSSVLWQRLMGTAVLEARAEEDPLLRSYAHCTPADAPGYALGAVTLALVNLDAERAVTADLAEVGTELRVWRLSAPELDSPFVELEGRRLLAQEDGTLPELAPVTATGSIRLAPVAVAFVVVSDAGAAACRPD